jgi:hypothetical protein
MTPRPTAVLTFVPAPDRGWPGGAGPPGDRPGSGRRPEHAPTSRALERPVAGRGLPALGVTLWSRSATCSSPRPGRGRSRRGAPPLFPRRRPPVPRLQTPPPRGPRRPPLPRAPLPPSARPLRPVGGAGLSGGAETPTPSARPPGDARIDRANEHMEKGAATRRRWRRRGRSWPVTPTTPTPRPWPAMPRPRS